MKLLFKIYAKIYIGIVFILCFGSLAIADDPDKLISYPPQKIMGYRGLDTKSSPPLIADSRAIDLKNVKLSRSLDLLKRPGYDTINNRSLDDIDTDSPAVTGIFDTEYSTGESWTVVFLGDRIKYDNSGTWTALSGSPNLTAGQNNLWKCVMALDESICTNNVDPLIKIDNTPVYSPLGLTGSVGVTRANDIVWYRNYFILANTTESGTDRPTRIRWTDVGTIDTLDADNYFDISTFGGDKIVGMKELYGELYVFLTKSIWQITLVGGDEVFVLRKVMDNIGCVSRESIRSVILPDNRTAIMFLDEGRKVFLFNGFAVVDAGTLIQDTLDNLSKARLQYAVSTFDGNSYYLSASNGSATEHDLLLEYNIYINEWSKHTYINANALGRVEETAGLFKTYFGNYDAFVYWLDNVDLMNDVDGAQGIIDSTGVIDTDVTITQTGAQMLIDADLMSGSYTGAVIKITSGTGASQEGVILTHTSTGIILTTALGTTPNATSVYEIGSIEAEYKTKWYDFGDSPREKQFLGMLLWAKEETNNEVDVTYYIDFAEPIGSVTVDLAPASASLWDFAIWDESIWGSTGEGLHTVKTSGYGNFIQYKFENDSIDKSFHLYGFNILGMSGDVKQ